MALRLSFRRKLEYKTRTLVTAVSWSVRQARRPPCPESRVFSTLLRIGAKSLDTWQEKWITVQATQKTETVQILIGSYLSSMVIVWQKHLKRDSRYLFVNNSWFCQSQTSKLIIFITFFISFIINNKNPAQFLRFSVWARRNKKSVDPLYCYSINVFV